jgi:hypothetical protein
VRPFRPQRQRDRQVARRPVDIDGAPEHPTLPFIF